MAKKNSQPATAAPPAAATEVAKARSRRECPPCPTNSDHKNRRVYKTEGRVQRCVCDDCGTTYKSSSRDAGDEHLVVRYEDLAALVDLPEGAEIYHVAEFADDAGERQFRVFYREGLDAQGALEFDGDPPQE